MFKKKNIPLHPQSRNNGGIAQLVRALHPQSRNNGGIAQLVRAHDS